MSRKKLGIIGGMGSVAGAYMLDRVVQLTPAKTDQEYIEIFVHNNSAIPDRTGGILYGGPSPLPELQRSIRLLNELDVDYIIIACITSHYFHERLQEQSKASIINVLSETACHTKTILPHVKKAGVIASTGAITLGLFQDQFKAVGIETTILNEADQKRYFTEPIYEEWGIKTGHVTGEPKRRFMTAVEILIAQGAEAIIAGCSELPLVIRQEDVPVPLVDSIDVLVKTAVNNCLDAAIYSL
ncbi:MAG: hypothetical protein A2W25_07110 [candidate division Zixibacteria bacterium RBG_16_53_22]|nr:MAG: hypothetical protein A2W25_07110 [candidate division Zixibacteria bacterium RBG_16_53_22]